MKENLITKDDLLTKLRSYAETPDDHVIRYKEKIKNNLLNCPELLYALNNSDYEDELFNPDGTINYDGDWDLFFGDNSNIRPYTFLPDTNTVSKTYLCYNVGFTDIPNANATECYMQVIFTILVDNKISIDHLTGISRQDLISSILRERFNWSNIFDQRCKLISNKEAIIDTNFIARTLIFQCTAPNAWTKTIDGKSYIINKKVRTK